MISGDSVLMDLQRSGSRGGKRRNEVDTAWNFSHHVGFFDAVVFVFGAEAEQRIL